MGQMRSVGSQSAARRHGLANKLKLTMTLTGETVVCNWIYPLVLCIGFHAAAGGALLQLMPRGHASSTLTWPQSLPRRSSRGQPLAAFSGRVRVAHISSSHLLNHVRLPRPQQDAMG